MGMEWDSRSMMRRRKAYTVKRGVCHPMEQMNRIRRENQPKGKIRELLLSLQMGNIRMILHFKIIPTLHHKNPLPKKEVNVQKPSCLQSILMFKADNHESKT